MKGPKKLISLLSIMLFQLLISMGISYAQTDYPTKPVTTLVPYPPGGVSDIMARLVSETAKKYSSQPFVIINREGGSGTVAITELVNSQPDGYTTALANNTDACAKIHLIPVRYTLDSYTIICQIGSLPAVIYTKGPWNTLNELVDYAKKNPGKIRAGYPPKGTFGHICGANLAHLLGLEWKEVHFTGDAPSIVALLGEHLEIGFVTIASLLPHYRSGQVKVLGIFNDERIKQMPDVPTIKEQGFNIPSTSAAHFLIVPNKVPQAILNKLEVLMKKVTGDSGFIEKANLVGYNVRYGDTEAAKAYMKEIYISMGRFYENLGMMKKR